EVHVLARRFGSQTLTMPIVAHQLPHADTRLGFAQAAQEKIVQLDLDVVHDTGCGWCCDVIQPHSGSRRVTAERNVLLAPRFWRPLKRLSNWFSPRYKHFDQLATRQFSDPDRLYMALSRRVASDLIDRHHVPVDQIRLIYNGVDTDRFTPAHRVKYRKLIRRRLGLSNKTPLLLVIAHNFRLKGIPTLLRMMARWNDPRRLHLAVVGGKRIGQYQRMAERLGVGSRVSFVGPVEDTVPFYAAADIYVHPTFYDPCSLVVLEAMASELPVITSVQDGTGELITDGVEGHVLQDPKDHEALLEHVRALLPPQIRQRMGKAARRLALEHTFDHNVDEIVAVYREIRELRLLAAEERFARSKSPFYVRRSAGAESVEPFYVRRSLGNEPEDQAASLRRLFSDDQVESGGFSIDPTRLERFTVRTTKADEVPAPSESSSPSPERQVLS
ncbi:MAG: glycosyltransferase, partial [Planctomycetia bacterium]